MRKLFIISVIILICIGTLATANAISPFDQSMIIIQQTVSGFCNIKVQGYAVFTCGGKNSTLNLTHGTGIVITPFQANQTIWLNATGAVGPQGPAGPTGPQGPAGPMGQVHAINNSTGIGINGTTGTVVVSNQGVTSLNANSPIGVSASTGAVTITCSTCSTTTTTINGVSGIVNIGGVTGNTTASTVGNTISINTAWNIVTTGLQAQTITKQLTVNNLWLGGQMNLQANTFLVNTHTASWPQSNSGTVLYSNGTGSSLSGIPTSITGTSGNITASASTGAITLNTGNNIAYLSVTNNQTFNGKINFTATSKLTGLNLGNDGGSDPTNLKPFDLWLTTNLLKYRDSTSNTHTIVDTGLGQTITGGKTFTGAEKVNGAGSYDYQTTSSMKVSSGGILLRNPSGSFATTINNGAQTANNTLTQPVFTGTQLNQLVGAFNSTQGDGGSSLKGNGSGTTSASGVMDGVYATLIPKYSDNATVTVHGSASASASGDGCRIQIRESTSNMGGNGAAPAGTLQANPIKMVTTSSTIVMPFSIEYTQTGLVAGTKVYFDLDQRATTGGTCTLTNVFWNIQEN